MVLKLRHNSGRSTTEAMGIRGNLFTFCLLAVLAVSGCVAQPKAPVSEPTAEELLLEYIDPVSADKYACAFGRQEGELAQSLAAPQIVSTRYFNKEYDDSFLLAVAKASIEQTYFFISQIMGLDVYRVKVRDAECRPFSFLGQAPTDLIEVWKQTEAAIVRGLEEQGQSNSKVNLSGMYLSLGGTSIASGEVLASTQARPAILIPDAASRWNLVHEMMHHLFDRRRLETGGLSLDEVRRQLSTHEDLLQNTMTRFEQNPTEDMASVLAEALEAYSKTLWATLTSFQLEEVVIESVLLQKFSEKVLSYFPDTIEASRRYINVKAYEADQRLKRVTALSTEIRVRFLTKLTDGSVPLSVLDKVDAEVAKWRDAVGESTGLPPGTGGLGDRAGLGTKSSRGSKLFTCSHGDAFTRLKRFPHFNRD